MKKSLAFLIIFASFSIYADSKSLQSLDGSEIDFTPKLQLQKQFSLDNPFAIQLFSTWKSVEKLDIVTNQWIELILDKKFEQALSLTSTIVEMSKTPKLTALKNASELYLLYETNQIQSFFKKWIQLASSTNFLETELGVALDQIVGPKTTQLIIENGFYLSFESDFKLKKIEALASRVNYSLQALKALRSGENAVSWIGKLSANDPFRMPLAQTALLHYARAGKLGASGKIIKNVVEPILNTSSNEEDLSLYFMTLGRLLYQAGAMAESKKYYELIPETSSYFLKARSEALWVYLNERDFSKTKGELATLELKLFDDKFYPEVYVISAMANVMLCQFTEPRAAINRFIDINKKWAKEIDFNLNNSNATPVTKNFFLTNLEKARLSLQKEKKYFESKEIESHYAKSIDSELNGIEKNIRTEIIAQWNNRKNILETALYKMNFVKIELISRMRAVEMNMNMASSDEVSRQDAATARSNQISFPKKGPLWGDELFNMSATIINKCANGELKR